MAVYFVSDFHLGTADRESEKLKLDLFDRFVAEQSSDLDHLVIIGDLFDFWFEYRHLIPKKHIRILTTLYRLRTSGCRITYICGNHDFWLGDFMTSQLGIEVARDSYVLETERGNILITHGDGIPSGDRGYRIMKRVFRNRVSVALYRLLPPTIAYTLAEAVSRSSRHRGDATPGKECVEEYHQYAQSKFGNGHFAFVCGHLHFPEIRYFGENVYVNTGDWIRHFSFVRWDGENFALHYLKP